MDVQMPDMDGLEATRQIREFEKNTERHLPIIAITAHALQGDRERFLAAGMDDYITKPLEPKVLLSALERWTQGLVGSHESVAPVQDYSSYETALPVEMAEGLFGEPAPAVSRHNNRPAPPVFQPAQLPVNFASALDRLGGDREFMLESFKQYREQLRARVAEICTAVQDSDTNRLVRLAHNLKGVSLTLSVNGLAALALLLEEMGEVEDLTNAPLLATQLEEEARRVEEYLSKSRL
jgi:two-component system sensor histidine kinase/response regulator